MISAPWVVVDTVTDFLRCRRCRRSAQIVDRSAEAIIGQAQAFLSLHLACGTDADVTAARIDPSDDADAQMELDS
jgi:hypothetical protein